MKKLFYKVIFLLSVTALLIVGNACKKVDWPVVPESSASKGDTNTTLDSMAVFNVIIGANVPTQTIKTVPGTITVKTTTNYSYSVSFSVYSPSDINFTTPLYS